MLISSRGRKAEGRLGVQRSKRLAGSVLCAAALLGCGNSGSDSTVLGSQPWGAYDVAVEIRPSPPHEGHNEVVVIVSGEHHRPIYDALVSVRAQQTQPWVQAIEDGHVGVYRRAVNFGHGPTVTLEVQLQREQDPTGVLSFPVTLQAAP